MPYFLKGEVADHSWVPPDTDEKMKAFSAFIEGPASILDAAGVIPAILEDVMEKCGGKISRWAALGFCWGYKVYLCLDPDGGCERGRRHHFIFASSPLAPHVFGG